MNEIKLTGSLLILAVHAYLAIRSYDPWVSGLAYWITLIVMTGFAGLAVLGLWA